MVVSQPHFVLVSVGNQSVMGGSMHLRIFASV
jgi:hypothetical protein